MIKLNQEIHCFVDSYLEKGFVTDDELQRMIDSLRIELNLSDVDILEVDVDNESICVSYSSVPEGKKAMHGIRIPVPTKDGRIIRSYYDEDGLSENVLGNPHIPFLGTMLHYCIMQENTFYGLLGIHTIEPGRIWTDKEKKMLIKVGRAITPFVARKQITSSTNKFQRASEQIDLVAEAVPGGFKVWQDDMDMTITYLTPKLAAIQGYEIKELYDKCDGSMLKNIHPEDRVITAKQIAKDYEETDSYRVKYRVICKDGTCKWVMDIGKKTTDVNGNIVNYSFVTDITKTEEQERLLVRERRRYRDSLLANAEFSYELDLTDGMVRSEIIMKDGKPMVGFINQSLPIHYDDLCRLSMEAMQMKVLDEKTAVYWTRQGLLNAFSRGEINAECEYYSAVANKYFRNSALMSLDEITGHVHSIMLCTDITELKIEQERTKQQLKEAYDEAKKANQAKSDFLSSMSHEIRTPMNAIIGLTDILLRKELPDDVTDYLLNIKSSGNGLLNIINDLLDFSKIEAGKYTIVEKNYDLAHMLKDMNIIGQSRIGDKNVSLHFNIDESVPRHLFGDGLRIRQILINLLNNAIKFTDQGSVTVSIKKEEVLDTDVKLLFSVKDTGIGIKEKDIDKLFDAFSQVDLKTNNGKEGTGLGLAISERLANLMGGKISVQSIYGQGSEFSFSIIQKMTDDIPIGNFNHTKTETFEKELLDFDFTTKGANILLVDDNTVNKIVTLSLLEPLMANIDCAKNGQKAIDMVQKKKYDLILMDHYMPVKNGVEATIEIRNFEDDYYKKVPIIALTADAIQSNRHLFIDAGMNDIVTKPIEIPFISKVLKRWLPQEMIQMKT